MHNHEHHDHHVQMGNKFLLGIVLNVSFVGVELFYGWKIKSISLQADAWHNLGDVLGLAISWIAFFMASKKPSITYTYGFSKGTILASLANAVLLFLAIIYMAEEAIFRLSNLMEPDSETIMWVAGIGVFINTITALLFVRSKELNNRAAFLHMAADALVSIAVIAGALLMKAGWGSWIDPLLGLGICIVIFTGTWKLFKSSLRLSLDGVPESIDIVEIADKIKSINGVANIDNMHLWAISTTRNAFTAQIALNTKDLQEQLRIKSEINHLLKSYRVTHTTLETVTKLS